MNSTTISDRHRSKLSYKFPKSSRLRLGYQYDTVRKKGTSLYGPLFRLALLRLKLEETAISSSNLEDKEPLSSVTTLPQNSDLSTQCGIIVSRRVGNAVVRNKVKRRLRELYRKKRSSLLPQLWLVMIATPQAATASLQELESEWKRLGERLSIFKNPETTLK